MAQLSTAQDSVGLVDDALNYIADNATDDKSSKQALPTDKPQVVFVLGGPGAGKGTQCQKLVDEFGLIHLSAGDLLRAERNSGSKNADLINEYIKNGEIVPVEITVELIKTAIKKHMESKHFLFVIDGFPRNRDNLDGWYKVMDGFAEVAFLLNLNCTEEEMEKRIMGRAAASTGPKRVDDNSEAIQKRFRVFKESTQPIIDVFNKDKKCFTVEALGSVDDIYTKVRRLFQPFFQRPKVVFVLGGPGSGKGTQCDLLVKEFGFRHLSAGDLLREERNSGSKDAELINDYIKNGNIVPVEITVNLIKRAMLRHMRVDGQYIFVIDGFPRNFDNLQGWKTVMGDFTSVPFLLFLECTESEMESRILARAEKSQTKRIDDNMEAIKKRFRVYLSSTMPVVEVFRKQNQCKQVKSIGKIDDIYAEVRKYFLPIIDKI